MTIRRLLSVCMRRPGVLCAGLLAAQLGASLSACGETVAREPFPSGPNPPARAPVAARCPEHDAARCPERDAARERCESFWSALRSYNVKSAPLELRTRLATTLVTATIDILDRTDTGWIRLDAEHVAAVVVLNPGRSAKRLLFPYNESGPHFRVMRETGDAILVEVLGSVDQPTAPAIALQLAPHLPGDCPCSGRFSWRLKDHVGALRPPVDAPGGGRRLPISHFVSTNVPSPRLVVEVALDGAGDFAVTRKAIEVNWNSPPIAITSSASSASSASSTSSQTRR